MQTISLKRGSLIGPSRILTLIAAMFLAIMLVPGIAKADEGDVSYEERSYVNGLVHSTAKTIAAGNYVVVNEDLDKTWGSDAGIWYVVNSNVTIAEHRIEVKGTANLILCDGVEFTATLGITVPAGSTLNIYSQKNDKGVLKVDLSTTNLPFCSGIGSATGVVGGSLNIHGGSVYASGSVYGAGIGCNSVIIYDGFVQAQGGDSGAGIGGGSGLAGGTVTIYDGTVYGWGGKFGAGIGGGDEGNGGTVNLYDATVFTRGGKGAEGIGCGDGGANSGAINLSYHSYIVVSSDGNTWVDYDPLEDNRAQHMDSKYGTNYIQMLRLYNPNSGEHFYTASSGERDLLVDEGWRWEGYAWRAPQTSYTPVYRLYNPNGGDHHYTMSAGELQLLVAEGWRDEGIGWYSDDGKSEEVLRQYNPNATTGAHNFTTSYGERDLLIALGWHDEGVAWYGVLF